MSILTASRSMATEDVPRPRISVEEALNPGQVASTRVLFEAYAQSLNFSLCFQGFDRELANLPGEYARPLGRLLLGWLAADAASRIPSGCVALRPLSTDICEMKRLYVAPEARGTGLGALLARYVIAEAALIGYRYMRLDTLPQMQTAQGLYEWLGFRPINNYNGNPLPGALFFQLDLSSAPGRL